MLKRDNFKIIKRIDKLGISARNTVLCNSHLFKNISSYVIIISRQDREILKEKSNA